MIFDWIQFVALPVVASPWTWCAGLLGAIIGSFLNVCIFRIPEGQFWTHARSICPHCKSLIPWYHNIPILSYLLLRGKAACCKASISPQYFWVELFTAIAFILLYWRHPFVVGEGAYLTLSADNLLRFGHKALLTSYLIVIGMIDFRHMYIPDVLSIPMLVIVPLAVWVHPDLNWTSAGIGIVAGAGFLYVIAWIYWLIRREVGLGFGDVKLLAVIGGWLGYQSLFPVILVGSITGSASALALMISRKRGLRTAIPFGPFLAFGAFLHMILGRSILRLLQL